MVQFTIKNSNNLVPDFVSWIAHKSLLTTIFSAARIFNISNRCFEVGFAPFPVFPGLKRWVGQKHQCRCTICQTRVLFVRAEAMSYTAAVACAVRFGSESHGQAVNHKTSDGFLWKYLDTWKSLMHSGGVYSQKMKGSQRVVWLVKLWIFRLLRGKKQSTNTAPINHTYTISSTSVKTITY